MRFILIISAFLLANTLKSQNTYYVATWGGDSNDGTIAAPWETWQKAFITAQAGDTVFFRGGVYYSLVRNDIDPSRGKGHNGTYENPIVYMSYPDEWAILDCSRHIETYGFGNNIYNGAIAINRAEHLYFKNFEVRNVFQLDSVISGGISATNSRNLTFEHIIMHDIGQRGFYIAGGAWLSYYEDGDTQTYPYWNSSIDTTKFINCDVFNLCDSISRTGSGWDPGNGADAWKTIHYRGNYILFQGCRAWNYTDDGFDPTFGNGATLVIDNCWAMASNKYANSFPGIKMERNAFKIAGAGSGLPEDSPPYTIITHNLSLFSEIGMYLLYYDEWGDINGKVYNNTSYGNGINFNGGRPTDTYRNNFGFKATFRTATQVPYECGGMRDGVTESHNTWDWDTGYPWFTITDTVTVTYEDFVGLTNNWAADSLYLVKLFTSPRQPDGSLPDKRPMMLTPNSDLIDAGTDVGLSYNGIAPDIGYFENNRDTETGNRYPNISIISPFDRAIFTNPSDITINVDTYDSDGSIVKVEYFYWDTINIDEVNSSPWSVKWERPPIGRYPLRAVVTDNEGAKTTSERVWITVLPDIVMEKGTGFLYPNPNNGLFTFLLTEPVQSNSKFRITTLDGRVVYNDTMQQEQMTKEFNLYFLMPGIYIITLFTNQILLTNKFIKL